MRGIKRMPTLLLALGLGVFLAACGTTPGGSGSGGGGGDSGGGDTSTVSVQAPGATAAAYRVAGGDWQYPDDPTRFEIALASPSAVRSLGADTPYDVVIACPGEIGTFQVFSLTPGEVGELNTACETVGGEDVVFQVSYDASAVSGTAYVVLFHKGGLATGLGSSGTVTVDSGGVAGEQDLVLLAVGGSEEPLAARRETVTVKPGGSYKITLRADDAANLGQEGPFPPVSHDELAASNWWVFAVTPNGTGVLAGGKGSPLGSDYLTLAFASHYAFQASVSDDPANPTESLAHSLTQADPAPPSNFPEFPARLSPGVANWPTAFSGLPGGGDLLGLYFELTHANAGIRVWLSAGYLGESTDYTLPVPPVEAFEPMAPPSGQPVDYEVTAFHSPLSFAEFYAKLTSPLGFLSPGLDLRAAWKKGSYTAP